MEARGLLTEQRQFLDSANTTPTFAAEMSEFLKTSKLTHSRAFVHSSVKKIEVKPGRADIVYSVPSPDDTPVVGADATEVALNGRVRSSVRLGRPDRRRLRDEARWVHVLGMIPLWAKDPRVRARMINARAETVAEKAACRDALRRCRCPVLTDGFW